LDLVLVTKLDRAFRSAKDTYDNLAYLEQHNVGFIAATQPIDTSTSTGKLLLGVLAAVAEFEKAWIVERTKEGEGNIDTQTRYPSIGTESAGSSDGHVRGPWNLVIRGMQKLHTRRGS